MVPLTESGKILSNIEWLIVEVHNKTVPSCCRKKWSCFWSHRHKPSTPHHTIYAQGAMHHHENNYSSRIQHAATAQGHLDPVRSEFTRCCTKILGVAGLSNDFARFLLQFHDSYPYRLTSTQNLCLDINLFLREPNMPCPSGPKIQVHQHTQQFNSEIKTEYLSNQ